jgi:hypothetical protein
MSAFLDLLSTYAIWIYIVGVVGILFGIKMLVDSRRLSRATMFTLEQEQAGDQAFRAIVVMVAFALLIGGVSAVNAFIAPGRPTPVPVVPKETTVAFTPVLVLPTFTTVPTLTPEPLTSTPTVPPTRAPQPTVVHPPTIESTPTSAPTFLPTASTSYPKPSLNRPVKGDQISADRLQFIWGQDQLPQNLPPGEFYRVVVMYTDRNTNVPVSLGKCSRVNGLDTKIWGGMLVNAHGEAVGAQFNWYVVVVQVTSDNPSDCDGGQGTPISPTSDTWTFFWH